MKKKQNSKDKLKIILVICIILIVVLFLSLILLKQRHIQQDNTILTSESITEEEKEEIFTDYIRPLAEKDRMQTYLAEFMRDIEIGEYSKAYEMLHPDFKEKFFPKESRFAAYAKKHYSSLIALEYESIERQGKYYILTVKVTNIEGSQTSITQKYIIQEDGLNDYYISFQVQYS